MCKCCGWGAAGQPLLLHHVRVQQQDAHFVPLSGRASQSSGHGFWLRGCGVQNPDGETSGRLCSHKGNGPLGPVGSSIPSTWVLPAASLSPEPLGADEASADLRAEPGCWPGRSSLAFPGTPWSSPCPPKGTVVRGHPPEGCVCRGVPRPPPHLGRCRGTSGVRAEPCRTPPQRTAGAEPGGAPRSLAPEIRVLYLLSPFGS